MATRKLPPQGGTPRDVASILNQALDGKLFCAKTKPVADGLTVQTISDPLVSASSVILISPNSAITRDALITDQSNGSFEVTFNSSPTSVTLKYAVLG